MVGVVVVSAVVVLVVVDAPVVAPVVVSVVVVAVDAEGTPEVVLGSTVVVGVVDVAVPLVCVTPLVGLRGAGLTAVPRSRARFSVSEGRPLGIARTCLIAPCTVPRSARWMGT